MSGVDILWSLQALMAAGSTSPGTSPGGLGTDSVAWAAMRQQQQQQQQQAAQLGQAQRIHAVLAATPGLQNVTLEQVEAPSTPDVLTCLQAFVVVAASIGS